jgi:tetratricopeptide (TPR) repeat protein
MKPSPRCLTLILALAIGLPSAYAGEEPVTSLGVKPGARPERKPAAEVVEMTVHPARPPRAALEHRLLPSYLEKTYGNAAPLYGKACLLLAQHEARDKAVDDAVAWIKVPVDQLPCTEVRATLARFEAVLGQLRLASRRTHCDWGLPIWESENPYGIQLPELQGSRDLARLIALEARLAIAEGRFDEAIGSLETGFALARHVADQSTLIGGLVGIAIASMMTNQLEALVQLPNAPNLYWTLTALPAPLVDLRDAIEMESVAVYLMLPQFAEVKSTKYTPAQWEALFDEEEIIAKFESLLELEPAEMAARKRQLKEAFERALPVAKRDLVAWGYSQEELDRMPESQVVVLHTALRFDELRDGMFKWFYLPYWQAEQGIQAAQKEVDESGKSEAIGLANILLPAVAKCKAVVTRSERRIAALRAIEAIRLYAAVHEGKLPKSLDEVIEVPIPVNPFTGKPFAYRLEGDTAILEAGGPEDSHPRQYRLELAE